MRDLVTIYFYVTTAVGIIASLFTGGYGLAVLGLNLWVTAGLYTYHDYLERKYPTAMAIQKHFE